MVTAGMTPRQAVGEVEARLTAAGCPDADYDARELFRLATGRDARLSDRLLSDEEANQLEVLCARREQREPQPRQRDLPRPRADQQRVRRKDPTRYA